jgi:hypothetical protein
MRRGLKEGLTLEGVAPPLGAGEVERGHLGRALGGEREREGEVRKKREEEEERGEVAEVEGGGWGC